jgi:hypothetical protein
MYILCSTKLEKEYSRSCSKHGNLQEIKGYMWAGATVIINREKYKEITYRTLK